jgi:hypothetical protein
MVLGRAWLQQTAEKLGFWVVQRFSAAITTLKWIKGFSLEVAKMYFPQRIQAVPTHKKY